MSKLTTFPRGILVGATLMYFLDPRRGRQRRSRIGDLLSHARRVEHQLVGKAARDASHRARGVVERFTHTPSPDVDDVVVEARARARLGRLVSHPHAIEISLSNGSLTIRGPVLEDEAEDTIRELRHVAGVREVVDLLERHATADIPSLQGEPGRTRNVQWAPSWRVAAVTGGGLLALYGLIRRGGSGLALTLAGGAVVARAAANMPLARLAGYAIGRERLDLQKTITVHAPIDRVFALWSHFENFPRFMQHVRSVALDAQDRTRSHWEVEGPAGLPLHFDTVTTRAVGGRELAWTTVSDQPIEHAGVVRFEQVPDGTRVDIRMTYRPPGGVLGHAVAHVLGWDPKARIDDDMVRMKALLEGGQTRAHGERVSADDVLH